MKVILLDYLIHPNEEDQCEVLNRYPNQIMDFSK